MANSSKGDLVAAFDFGLRLRGIPTPEKELQFHPVRKWRFDRAWPDHKVAVEIHGGIWTGGRHTRGRGFLNDREKMNTAQLMGWTVLEVCDKQIEDESAFAWVREALGLGEAV